ncbi:MAG: hypothetical protein II507_10800 [Treponema sp.]|nr:hypothetical protein [Treponema sp.]MBR4385271.1 hypothetical protein [Treponema sp.]
MKKTIVIALLLLCTLKIFALVDDDDPLAEARYQIPKLQGWYDFSDVGVEVSVSPDWIVFEGEKIPRKEFRLAKNGWYYIKDNLVIFDQFHHLFCWHNSTLNFHPAAGEKVPYGSKAHYTQSSYFTETLNGNKIAYDAENLNSVTCKPGVINENYDVRRIVEEYEHFFIWNEEHRPWVTQKVGESVTAEFDDEANAVSLLNGYVDPYHPDYYKKNARIKDIKITDENGKDYFFTLKDEVRVQTFMLDNCTKKVTLTVLSVYAGEKYGDIALSMFAGVYADTYIDWIVFRELEAAKERAESAYHSYLWNLENYPKNIPHDCSLIKSEWTMYYMTVEDRIKKEFGGKFAEHDIEIYDSPDLKIHLAVVYHNIVTVFYAKEKITKYGYEFKNMPDIISGPFEDDDYEYSSYATEKDGWIISAFWYGAGDTCALPVSARFKVMTESGKIRKVVISKEGLKGVKRFGELLIGASDLK